MLIREVLADPDWIVLGVVEGLNPWKDEDHARTQEVPR